MDREISDNTIVMHANQAIHLEDERSNSGHRRQHHQGRRRNAFSAGSQRQVRHIGISSVQPPIAVVVANSWSKATRGDGIEVVYEGSTLNNRDE